MKKVFLLSNIVFIISMVFLLADFLWYFLTSSHFGFDYFNWVFGVALVAQVFNLVEMIKLFNKKEAWDWFLGFFLWVGINCVFASMILIQYQMESIGRWPFFIGFAIIAVFLILQGLTSLIRFFIKKK